ncbi:hypothetical protein BpHYR1_024392 [Brachionus plicatilis]|uniref:MULE transposase domain-containing protein n=1 Tax=Brachionus plicatilis TaxID=10195 RepID=A0A3M7QS46_BRAPC|nr:hypothetical protein BpHYR1_024392 [Brachionus plicatilis]
MASKSPDTESSLNYCSQDEISADKKTRGKNKNYFSLCSFRDYSSANKALKETFDNQKWRKGNIKGGDKRYYSCNTNGVKSDCPVRMYLFMHSDSQICTVYMSTDEHNHPGLDTESDSNRLSFQIREEIIRIYENETHQTNLIIEKLRMKNFKATKIQIYNLIHRYKINQSESKNTTLNQLRDYCSSHKSTPLDSDQVYIPDTYFRYGLNVLEEFRIFLTTKRLIQMATKANCVHIDVTYKLLWHGLPVIIIGTTDCSHNFHPFGLTICKHQNENDFAFTFQAVSQQLKLLYDHEVEPGALVAEADPAIEQAFGKVFKNKFERVLSWPHVLKEIDSKLNIIKDNRVRKCIREDIVNVQLHAETYNFKSVVSQVLKKWQNYQLDSANLFVDYFRENWIEKNSCWFEAFAPQIAKTNNALDLIDALVKKENSFRKQLPAADFLDMVSEKLLKRWSSERSESHSGSLLFKSCVEPSMENWRSAWQWELLHNSLSISKKTSDTCSIFYIPSEKLENVDEELIENYIKPNSSNTFLASQIAGGVFVEKFSANEKIPLLKTENNQENLEPAMKQKKRGRPAGSKNLIASTPESNPKRVRQL